MPIEKPRWAWMDGEFVPYEKCVLHVRTQAVMTGGSVFEGFRGYWNSEQQELYLFRMADHLERLRASMKVMRMVPLLGVDVSQICLELIARNEFRTDVGLVPAAYFGVGPEFSGLAKPQDEGLFITAVARQQMKSLISGIHIRTSSWRRISDANMPPRVKTAANYHNSRLALIEARADGYDNAIFLNHDGTVAEATGASVLMVRKGQLCTPPITSSILESVTRSTLLELASELGVEAVERPIDRTELYVADEVLLCGTAQEVTPVLSLDRIPVGDGNRGPITRRLQELYSKVVRGEDGARGDWRTPVYSRLGASAAT
jgi:branched-chain amino acid aminotransferase